jgi:hypothetical protein
MAAHGIDNVLCWSDDYALTAALVDQKLDVIVSMQFKQARSPASACLQLAQQPLAARPPRKGRTLARPSYSALLPVNINHLPD